MMSNQLHLLYEDDKKKVHAISFITWRALSSYIWENHVRSFQINNDAGDTIIRVYYLPGKNTCKVEYYTNHIPPASFLAQIS